MTTVDTIIRNKGAQVITVRSDTTLGEAARMLAKHRIGAVVVSEDGAAVNGILSERDLVRQLAAHGVTALDQPVHAAMTRHVMTCPPHAAVHEIMNIMTRKRIRHLPVVSQNRLVGIISIGDVVKCRLEETRLEASVMRDYAIARA